MMRGSITTASRTANGPWYDNGQKLRSSLQTRVQDGEHTGWYTNGKISAMGEYKDGKREGVWKRWDAQGFKNWKGLQRRQAGF